jgi:hypothetical protein
MNRMHAFATYSGIIAAAAASVATSPPYTGAKRRVDGTVTLTAEAPVATIRFKISSSAEKEAPSLRFSVGRSDSETKPTDNDPKQDCVPVTQTSPTTGKATIYRYYCVPKGTLLPVVLVQTREITGRNSTFNKASPIDNSLSRSEPGPAPVCYDLDANGIPIIASTKCEQGQGFDQCGGARSCDRTFEVRLFLPDRTAGPKTVRYRADIEASTPQDKDESLFVDIQPAL